MSEERRPRSSPYEWDARPAWLWLSDAVHVEVKTEYAPHKGPSREARSRAREAARWRKAARMGPQYSPPPFSWGGH